MLHKIKSKIKKIILRNNRIAEYLQAASRVNYNTFAKHKDENLGQEVVLCGAGPSFKKYIPMKNVKHVALNRALLNEKVKFDYFIADDWLGVNFMQEFLQNYDCVKFFGHQIGDYEREIPETFARKCKADRYYTDSFMVQNGFESELVSDIDYMPIGNMPNIALSALQIVLYTNPKRIYLVGCDASTDGHYNKKVEAKVSKEQLEKQQKDLALAVAGNKVLACWEKLKNFIAAFYPDVEIVSINPVGLKGLFNDKYQDEDGTLYSEK